jgi:hypothetical protein
MKLDELRRKAMERVTTDNPEGIDFRVHKVYENIMDGTVISVFFKTPEGQEDSNHVHFGRNEVRVYRWHGDVLNAVSGTKERVWFFRFIELAGIGGVIAFVLVLIFSVLLCVLAFVKTPVNPTILEVVKLSFTIILGYFFGSQTARKA